MVKQLDLRTLKKEVDSFVDHQLKDHFADLLYQCKFGKEHQIEIAFLFEHKSKPSPYIHFQILRYMGRVWDARIRNGDTPQVILPILVYHGEERWEMRSFSEQFGKNAIPDLLLPFLPSFECWMVNLQKTSKETIKEKYDHTSLRMALLLMKFIRSPNLLSNFSYIFEEGRELMDRPGGQQEIEVFILYLFEVTQQPMDSIKQQILEIIKMDPVEGTPAWQLKQEGRDAGRIAERMEAATRMLKKGFSIEETAELTTLPLGEVVALKAQLSL